jgi:hypothetical protein
MRSGHTAQEKTICERKGETDNRLEENEPLSYADNKAEADGNFRFGAATGASTVGSEKTGAGAGAGTGILG